MNISTIFSLMTLLLNLVESQQGLVRVCRLQLVVDHLLWAVHRERVVRESSAEEEGEISRIARCVDERNLLITEQN